MRTSDVSGDIAPSTEISIYTEEDAAGLFTTSKKTKNLIEKLGFVETKTVRRYEELEEEVKERVEEVVSVLIEISLESPDCLINRVKITKADIVDTSMER